MNARDAMREAHRLAAVLIDQARSTAASGWADNEDDNDHIDSALGLLAQRHRCAARGTTPEPSGGES